MGIKDFNTHLKKQGFKPIIKDIKALNGFKVAVDISIFFYNGKYVGGSSKLLITDYILNMLYTFVKYNIYPIFIFDGKSCPLKANTVEERSKSNEKNKQNFNEIGEKKNNYFNCIQKEYGFDVNSTLNFLESDKEYKELCKKFKKCKTYANMTPKKEEVDIIKHIFDLLKVHYLAVNEHEAENFCAWLSCNDYIDAVITNDFDVFLSGCKCMIFKFKYNSNNVTMYYYDEIMKSLKLTNDMQLVNYGILLGTDYNKRIRGNGPVRSYKIIINSEDYGKSELLKLYEKYEIFYKEFKLDYRLIFKDIKTFNDNFTYLKDAKSRDCLKEVFTTRSNYEEVQLYLDKYEHNTKSKSLIKSIKTNIF